MRMWRLIGLFTVALLSQTSRAGFAAPPSAPPQSTPGGSIFSDVKRIVAIGDLHGDFEKFTAVLHLCQLSRNEGGQERWIGGATHLVQTGDVLDRGPDSKKVMDLLMSLETQAQKAGGRVHALIGNHEYMVMSGDLRYVSDGELAAFGEGPRGVPPLQPLPQPLPRFRAAFSATGTYGRWILSHNSVVRINDTLFMHGGLSPRYLNRDIAELNRFVVAELRGERDAKGGVGADPEGPLWFRGLAESMQPQLLEAFLQSMWTAQKARRIVMGHTIQERGITLRAGDRLALIDVGMSRWTLNGAPSCLVIEKQPDGERVNILR
jgi:hypothetical protein